MNPRERGFSLLEVLVASVVFAVVSGAVVGVLHQSQKAFQTQSSFNEVGVEARMALHHVMRTLRHAGNDPLEALDDAGVDAVEILGQGHFRVNSDITGSVVSTTANPKEQTGGPDGELDAVYEAVEYRYDSDSKQLIVNVGYGETVLASDIESLVVEYFDAGGFSTTVDSEVARVKVLIVAASETEDRQTGRKNLVTLQSEMTLRSRTFDLYSLF